MLRYLFQRLWANTLVYLTLIAATTAAFSAPWLRIFYLACLALSTLWYITTITYAYDEERRLQRLGKHAPSVHSYLPWGIDTILRALYAFSQWRNHEFWYWMFACNRNKENPYTVEEITVGQRIIFTADEENIKAVLATRFQDYGKGEQFRKEWKDFLGLSMLTLSFFPLVMGCVAMLHHVNMDLTSRC
jgi:hypothetical protein